METDYPEAYSKGREILNYMHPLCKKHGRPFRKLSKAEQGWLLDTLMTYIRIDIKSSEILELDNRIIHSLQTENADLHFQNDKLSEQIQEMRHYD